MLSDNPDGNQQCLSASNRQMTGILSEVLRRYKAIIFTPKNPTDVDEQTIDRLMDQNKRLQKRCLYHGFPVIRFPVRWLAAAAGILVLTGASVLQPWEKENDWVILNTLSMDASRFAMRDSAQGVDQASVIVDAVKKVVTEQFGEGRLVLHDEMLTAGKMVVSPDTFPDAMLKNVTQRYVLLLAEDERSNDADYVLVFYDARTRKCLGIFPIHRNWTPFQIEETVRRIVGSTR